MPDMTPPLTDDEIKAIRAIIKSDDHVRWAWSVARLWAGYVSAVVVALWWSWDYITKVLHALVTIFAAK